MKFALLVACAKMQLGIESGAGGVKVMFTVTKNRKTVSPQLIKLGMRYHTETCCVGCLWKDLAWD